MAGRTKVSLRVRLAGAPGVSPSPHLESGNRTGARRLSDFSRRRHHSTSLFHRGSSGACPHESSFVQGHRALIERKAATEFGLHEFGRDRWRTLCRFQLRGLKHAYRWPWPLRRVRQDLRGVRGCNLAIWRSDLVRVNGYNEAFVGWGREDSELAVRLMNSGVRRLDVRGWALCYHLWHPPVSRNELAVNDELLAKAIREKSIRCKQGLDRHLTAA